MSVTLTPEHEAMVQERVASGRYRDAQEVIGDALRLLAERERIQRALLEVGSHDQAGQPADQCAKQQPQNQVDHDLSSLPLG